jgi:hypothetical protein
VVERGSDPAVGSHAGMPPLSRRWGLVRDPQGTCAPQALRCTDLTVEPGQILEWFVRRWRLDVTWQEARAHRGLETPRPWHAWAMARTTPALLGLVSLVTRWAGQLAHEHARPVRHAVWSRQLQPTVAEAIAAVRQHLWLSTPGSRSPAQADRVEIPCALLNRLTDTLCYAA